MMSLDPIFIKLSKNPGVALYNKLCLAAPYCQLFAEISSISTYFEQKTWKCVLKMSLDPIFTKLSQSPGVALYNNLCLAVPYCHISADISSTSKYFEQKT